MAMKLTPLDSDMEKFHGVYLASVNARIAGAKISQLAMAAPLESTASSSSSKPRAAPPPESTKPVDPKEGMNQKVSLVTALLAVGALRPGLAIMTRFPWIVDAYPEVSDLVLRVLRVSIAGYYDSTFVQKERNPSFTVPRARYGASGLSMPPPRKPQLTLWAPTPPCTNTVDFVFFFPNWTDRVPVCSVSDDLVHIVEPLLAFIKVHVSRDPLFLTKFTRLGRLHLGASVRFMFRL